MLTRKIAFRYLFGKRTLNAVPVLSRISMAAIAIGSCAMIVLFSVFNGFDGLIRDLYKAFYPEIKITAAKGKFFKLTDTQYQQITALNGIQAVSCVLEDNVLLSNMDEQQVATLKGIDARYREVNDLQPYIYDGRDTVTTNGIPTAIVGLHLAHKLGLDIHNPLSWLSVYYPNTSTTSPSLNPSAAFHSLQLKPDGIFRVQDEFDGKYVLAPIAAVQDLFGQEGQYSSIEIALITGTPPGKIRNQLQQLLGDSFVAATRYEQNKTLYLVMQTEKWAVYAMLVMVLFIASFNMTGALTMLVMEKQKDIAILKAMGVRREAVRRIFLIEGILWALTGGGIGLLLGIALCAGQAAFHWVTLEGAFIIEAYPVTLRGSDCIIVVATVLLVGLAASIYPSGKAARATGFSLRT